MLLNDRVKSLARLMEEAGNADTGLRRTLGPLTLTAMGIGGIIGTGIFVLTGIAAATKAGPGLTISFAIAGFVAALAALCYAEVASIVPIAGSAYTYAYVTVGGLLAWIIGWDLILDYGVGASTVSIGWSGALVDLLHGGLGIAIPAQLTHSPFDLDAAGHSLHGIANLPAAFIILAVMTLLIRGTRESSLVNAVIVVIKLSVIGLFLAIGARHIDPANWHPYLPFGWHGVLTGAAFIFFAYIGFDAMSTAAEETKNPRRDLPIGIIATMITCTVLYIAVVAVLTAVAPYNTLNVPSPVSHVILSLGINWAGAFISVGVLCGLTTVLLTQIFGQSRIIFAMSRDGLLPGVFNRLHGVWKTPFAAIIGVGAAAAVAAALTPIGVVSELSSIGALGAFTFTAVALLILRYRYPEVRGVFRVPFVPLLPAVTIVSSLFLVTQLQRFTLIGFSAWIAAGLLIYAGYGRRRSAIGSQSPGAPH
ncbi:MAG: amino acid permease [Vulcanimicrobiaceae bacterium]